MKYIDIADYNGAPRTGGDEPAWLSQIQSESKCSPHGRG